MSNQTVRIGQLPELKFPIQAGGQGCPFVIVEANQEYVLYCADVGHCDQVIRRFGLGEPTIVAQGRLALCLSFSSGYNQAYLAVVLVQGSREIVDLFLPLLRDRHRNTTIELQDHR